MFVIQFNLLGSSSENLFPGFTYWFLCTGNPTTCIVTYLLKFICEPQIYIHSAFMITLRHVHAQSGEKCERPDVQISLQYSY